jgi:hypothetical protein
MRVCVISPFIDDGSSTYATLPASGQNILDFIGLVCNDYDFIVLAAYNVNCYPDEVKVRGELVNKKSSATVFMERGDRNLQGARLHPSPPLKNPDDYKAFFVSVSNIFSMPKQTFSQVPTEYDINLLQHHIQERFYDVQNKKILLLICGEIDAFQYQNIVKGNVVVNGNVVVKNRKVEKKVMNLDWGTDKKDRKGVDIIINPAYTLMPWRGLMKKSLNLSMNQRIVIHTANNNQNHAKEMLTSIKVFFDGRESLIIRNPDYKHKLRWASFEIKTDATGNRRLYRIDVNHNSTKYHNIIAPT